MDDCQIVLLGGMPDRFEIRVIGPFSRSEYGPQNSCM
jgi:hypothetical protein